MPNYLGHDSTTWLGHSAIIVFFHYAEYQPRCETLIKSCSCLGKSCMLHSRYTRYTSCSAHINVHLPGLAECNSNRSFTFIYHKSCPSVGCLQI
jgi:hypothetical protein